jgi:hypothetical protein
MARPQTKTTPESNGRQRRSPAATTGPNHDRKDRRNVSHANGNGAESGDIRTRIEKLAYEIYQQRGEQDGYHLQDWLEAERLTLMQPEVASQDVSGRLVASFRA